ncbi:hypothetical protein MVEN_00319500 [Mycena venus]|uniref:Integrase core domain-containing protein n=1 Tax=Mycena venus TaxID=2733690 RepID=A0A8H6YQS1_9AGAR|nr:hypothetical protein MVEN_00319500 [Mycena venus]
MTSLGYQLYVLQDDSVESTTSLNPEDASTKDLKAYRCLFGKSQCLDQSPFVQCLSRYTTFESHITSLNGMLFRLFARSGGDSAQLSLQVGEVLRLLQAAEQHCAAFPSAEYAVLQQSITAMVQQLDEARYLSSDPPGAPDMVVSQRVATVGRPRIEIDPEFLAQAIQLRGPLASVFRCSARTVRRRLLHHGLSEPGQRVYNDTPHADGTIARSYTSTSRPVSTLTDSELDALLTSILESAGHHVPRDRITASYLRIHGTPGRFGVHSIHRKPYKVAGANSLWHHDGQHGLIPFKIVIHGFVDGKSQFVTTIHASNNNRADTVLDVFLCAVAEHGLPSRMRGDHGTENVLVAAYMEENRGVVRGSYIWGRSVHNTQIERLWYDVTHRFGQKWKRFFLDLEVHHGLNPLLPAHIWLLHHLFLDAINCDAQEWAAAWNSHLLQIRSERSRSPRDMYIFNMLQDGPRGLEYRAEPPSDDVEDPTTYGIDWDVADDSTLMTHLLDQNPQDWDEHNPFSPRQDALPHVPCDAPDAPLELTREHIAALDAELASTFD